MKDTELLYSEDLGVMSYSKKLVHCCLNIYHYYKNGHKQDLSIPGILECRHIFRTGKSKHGENLLNFPWDFRIAAWEVSGSVIGLLDENETCPNEIVLQVEDNIRPWVKKKL